MLNNLSEILKAIKKLSEQDFNELLNALTNEKSSETFDSILSAKKFQNGRHPYHSVLKTWILRFHGVATKYLNNYLVWHNFVNYAKEGYLQKLEILQDFVFTTNKSILCKEISIRNPIPVRQLQFAA